MNTSIANGLSILVTANGKELITSGLIHINQPNVDINIDTFTVSLNFKSDVNSPTSRYESTVTV